MLEIFHSKVEVVLSHLLIHAPNIAMRSHANKLVQDVKHFYQVLKIN